MKSVNSPVVGGRANARCRTGLGEKDEEGIGEEVEVNKDGGEGVSRHVM